jgi:hypothetical protein
MSAEVSPLDGDTRRAYGALTVSTLDELQQLRSGNPDLVIMEERIQGLQGELDSTHELIASLRSELSQRVWDNDFYHSVLVKGHSSITERSRNLEILHSSLMTKLMHLPGNSQFSNESSNPFEAKSENCQLPTLRKQRKSNACKRGSRPIANKRSRKPKKTKFWSTNSPIKRRKTTNSNLSFRTLDQQLMISGVGMQRSRRTCKSGVKK